MVTANPMHVELTVAAPADWDAYVQLCPDATAYHFADAVAIGARSFGLRTSFLTARNESGGVLGVLPLVEQSSLAFGRYLTSVPFFTYGGVLSDSDEVHQALVRCATTLAVERRADHIELRHTQPVAELDWPERLDKVSMVLQLPRTEELLAKQLGSKLRSQIKRAEREDPEVLWGHGELLDMFYPVFSATMHDLGTPVYSRLFFREALRAFGQRAEVLAIRVAGVPQAVAILVRHGDRIEVPWAAATPAAKRGALNMRMYWEMLRRAVIKGAPAFDFGRSTVDSGTYRFKAQWGAVPMQLHWYYWLPAGRELPKLNHSNPRYALAAAAWRRMPLWCANWLGPYLSRNLP